MLHYDYAIISVIETLPLTYDRVRTSVTVWVSTCEISNQYSFLIVRTCAVVHPPAGMRLRQGGRFHSCS